MIEVNIKISLFRKVVYPTQYRIVTVAQYNNQYLSG